MNIRNRHFFISVAAYVLCMAAAFAATAPNPRSATSVNSAVSSARADGRAVSRGGATNSSVTGANLTSRAAASNTVSRSASNIVSRAGTSRAATNTVSRAASNTVSRAGTSRAATNTVSRAASNGASHIARAGTARAATTARAAARATSAQSRAARATAVFTDISKIGGGYAACRESYATCMDQFCAIANDTYRRCYCSSEYEKIRDTESALEEAKNLIAQFENNNLAAVSLSEGEANAMYVATIGEEAIKNDTSKSAELLNNISDLLSGKKKTKKTSSSNESMGIIEVGNFELGTEEIWSGGGSDLFGNTTTKDYSTLSGLDLYNDAHKQCVQLSGDACDGDAVRNMAVSAYSIMISNDCNTYQKRVDGQRTAVENVVREAEKQLREARLEDYRSHNSADVNDCLDKVRTELFKETACGQNYRRCLDYTGSYVSPTTGEALYTPQLFKLTTLINLDGEKADVLAQNQDFNNFLESRKMFATTALDSCRNIADTVWTEFKRAALIEIAQAQDALIEEVKSTCVSTMAECYDNQSGQLTSFDTSRAKSTGAISAATARDMCMDKVAACALLYSNETNGGGKECTFKNGKVQNPEECGLASLLNFVSAVDDIRVSEGCASAIETELKSFCADKTGVGYPWGCRTLSVGNFDDNTSADKTIAKHLFEFAKLNCVGEKNNGSYKAGTDVKAFSEFPDRTQESLKNALADVEEQLDSQMAELCESNDGYWVSNINYGSTTQLRNYDSNNINEEKRVTAFYAAAFNGNQNENIGKCIQNTTLVQCQAQNEDDTVYATYNAKTDRCDLSDEWFRVHCEQLGGYYENSMCYTAKEQQTTE